MGKKRVKLIPFPVIVAAVAGEIDAIHIVFKHYTRYILALSKKYQGEDEQLDMYMDAELWNRMERGLTTGIMSFRFS